MNSTHQNHFEYPVTSATNQRKRTCLTLDLKDNPELIDKYKYYHARENNWPEINDGIKAAGILLMDIYVVDNRMFMICEIDKKDDFDEVWEKIGSYPRQEEWADLMNNFIQAIPNQELKWIKMKRVYELP